MRRFIPFVTAIAAAIAMFFLQRRRSRLLPDRYARLTDYTGYCPNCEVRVRTTVHARCAWCDSEAQMDWIADGRLQELDGRFLSSVGGV